MKKGVSLAVLSVIILVMVILATAATTTGSMALNSSKKMKFASEIAFVQEIVTEYQKNNGEYPITTSMNIDLTNVTTNSLTQFDNEVKDGNIITLYEINFTLLGKTDLIYGTKDGGDEKDIYAVSKETGKVYYLKGVKMSNITYYTLTDDLKAVIDYNLSEISQNETEESLDTNAPIIEVVNTQEIVNERNNEKSTYINVKITDNYSGIKYAKYETTNVSQDGIKQYFATHGLEIKNNTIIVDRYTTEVTIYAEDNNGNYTSQVITLNTIVSTNDYVKNGLVLHYDGINNTGSGHSNTARVWKDLSGSDNDATLGSDNTFDNNSCIFVKTTNSGFSPDNPLKLGVNGGFTIECIAKSNTTATSTEVDNSLYDFFWNLRDNGSTELYLQFIRHHDGKYYCSCNIDRNQILKVNGQGGNIVSNQIVVTNNTIKGYYNGEIQQEENITIEQLNKLLSINNFDIGFGAWYTGTSKLINLNGNIYSIRVYNRPLTEKEILQNNKVDKLRFGI